MATLRELAERLNGRLAGDGQTSITGAAPLYDAKPGQITFIDQPDKAPLLEKSQAAAALVPPGTARGKLPVIEVDDVHAAFVSVFQLFYPPRPKTSVGVSPHAFVSPTAKLAENVNVYPGAFIGDDVEIGPHCTIHAGVRILAGCKLGADVTVHPNAVLYEDTRVGDRCIIHAAAVLGAHGFGYKLVDGRHKLCAQLGWVELGPDVEVGAGTTIDRGAYGPTRIGEGTKIDNQVMIAHNCQIGKHNLICSQVGIAGSSSTGDYVVMAGQVGVRDHIHIGSRAILGAMSGFMTDVPEGGCWLGLPATPERDQWLKQAAFAKLPEMRRELKNLKRTVDELQKRLSDDRSAAA